MRDQTDPYLDVQNRIIGQIGALAEALPRCAFAEIVRGIDDIRCLARDNGFAAVETLASRLESAVAGGGYRAAILTYLDAMSDAVQAPRGPMPAAAHEAWLASVASRLGH
ncbi:conserved protein of unknown function [uncultured Sphingopyxis sp.]|uniref:Uncharacterized protein n=1 Tax=uncultured Sphingopyxis sp. TaxID=310581 RepID=A0A1Y5PYB9_9SPHN|nr:hypothetical protein [uncultured Sphingopyxis sp.]SBV34960.1 conserved protein of unknown function [uncultured Sphingopyxis sp.]